ncbi:MAG: Short-chain dehydrogenase/reductase [Gammaproteobacteria bacterium]|nr:Short-chain dehydrogenase/reductase [Gammaproteobacteria bacterium]
MIKLNYFSLVYGIEAALPLLRDSADPHIIGMSSMAAFHGLPLGEAYSASKAAALNLLQGLRADLKNEGLAVSVVCPGFVDTPLTAKHQFHMPFLMGPEKAAKIIVKGIIKKKAEIAFPKIMILGLKSLNFLPSALVSYLLNKAKNKAQQSD